VALPIGIVVAIVATTFTKAFTKAMAHSGTGAPTTGPSLHTTGPQIHLWLDRNQPLENLQIRNKRLREIDKAFIKD
jgi:hypothetical protein